MRRDDDLRLLELFEVLLDGRSKALRDFDPLRRDWNVGWKTIRRDLQTLTRSSRLRVYSKVLNKVTYWWSDYPLKPRTLKATHKQCTKCRQWFPLSTENFSRKKSHLDGFSDWCKPCLRKATARWERRNRARKYEINRKYYEANKAKILAYRKE